MSEMELHNVIASHKFWGFWEHLVFRCCTPRRPPSPFAIHKFTFACGGLQSSWAGEFFEWRNYERCHGGCFEDVYTQMRRACVFHLCVSTVSKWGHNYESGDKPSHHASAMSHSLRLNVAPVFAYLSAFLVYIPVSVLHLFNGVSPCMWVLFLLSGKTTNRARHREETEKIVH